MANQPVQRATPVPETSRTFERALIGLAVLALWSMVPPYLGPLVGLELNVPANVEVVDHILPGLSAAVAACIALSYVRRGEADSIAVLAALGVCVLAGLFQAVSHFTLVLDAGEPQTPVDTVILHATPGPALLVLSLWLLLWPPSQ